MERCFHTKKLALEDTNIALHELPNFGFIVNDVEMTIEYVLHGLLGTNLIYDLTNTIFQVAPFIGFKPLNIL
jgi:hypothetical protein